MCGLVQERSSACVFDGSWVYSNEFANKQPLLQLKRVIYIHHLSIMIVLKDTVCSCNTILTNSYMQISSLLIIFEYNPKHAHKHTPPSSTQHLHCVGNYSPGDGNATAPAKLCTAIGIRRRPAVACVVLAGVHKYRDTELHVLDPMQLLKF